MQGIYKDSLKGQQDGRRISANASAKEQEAFAEHSSGSRQHKRTNEAIAAVTEGGSGAAAESGAAEDTESRHEHDSHDVHDGREENKRRGKDAHDGECSFGWRHLVAQRCGVFRRARYSEGSGILSVAGRAGRWHAHPLCCLLACSSTVLLTACSSTVLLTGMFIHYAAYCQQFNISAANSCNDSNNIHLL